MNISQTLEIDYVENFKRDNYYGQRLYDLLRLWSGTKNVINYKVDYFKECLQLTSKYPNFKRRVILPAIKELNDTGYFEIDFKENKVIEYKKEEQEDLNYKKDMDNNW